MSIVQEAQMHQALIIARENSTLCLLIELLCLCGTSSQCRKNLLLASGNELGVSKAFVVTAIAQELSSVFEKILQIVVADADFLLERDPIAVAIFVKRYYEVVDWLRFRADLAESDSCTGEGSSVAILAVAHCI